MKVTSLIASALLFVTFCFCLVSVNADTAIEHHSEEVSMSLEEKEEIRIYAELLKQKLVVRADDLAAEQVELFGCITKALGSCLIHPTKCIDGLTTCVYEGVYNGDGMFGNMFKFVKDFLTEETGSSNVVMDLVKACLANKATDWLGTGVPSFVEKLLPAKGPFDDIVCDMFNGAKNGFDFSDVSIGHLKECSANATTTTTTKKATKAKLARRLEATFLTNSLNLEELEANITTAAPSTTTTTTTFNVTTDCSEQAFGITDMKDFFKSAWDTIKGEDSGIMNSTVTSLKDCWSQKTMPKTTCIGTALIGSSCSSSCKLIDCEVRKLYYGGNKPCKEAIRSTCSAAFVSANKLCATMMAKVNMTSSTGCESAQLCKDINGASFLDGKGAITALAVATAVISLIR